MRGINKQKIIWFIFYLYIFSIFLSATNLYFLNNYFFKVFFPTFLPLFLVVTHSFFTLNLWRSLFFISTTAISGFIFEFYGLTKGVFFGGSYIYNPNLRGILGVPILIILYWVVFVYIGYSITNSFLYWKKISKPRSRFFIVPLLSILDGIIVTSIDLFMDPIYVKAGLWTWLDKGSYFGVPIGNFVGWFVVAFVSSFIFRVFEYLYYKDESYLDKKVFLIPVFIYIIFSLLYSISAINLGLHNVLVVGLLIMLPIPIINLFLYKKRIDG